MLYLGCWQSDETCCNLTMYFPPTSGYKCMECVCTMILPQAISLSLLELDEALYNFYLLRKNSWQQYAVAYLLTRQIREWQLFCRNCINFWQVSRYNSKCLSIPMKPFEAWIPNYCGNIIYSTFNLPAWFPSSHEVSEKRAFFMVAPSHGWRDYFSQI